MKYSFPAISSALLLLANTVIAAPIVSSSTQGQSQRSQPYHTHPGPLAP
jgi:hypothetical protein